MSARTLIAGLLFAACGLSAMGSSAQPTADTVDRVRNTVARVLKKPPSEIDASRLLVEQGADELDIMEVVLDIEAEFKVRIPDRAIGSTPGEIGRVLTVERLSEIVSRLPQRR